MSRIQTVIVIMVFIVFTILVSDGSSGIHSECINDECNVEISTSLGSVVLSPLLIVFILFYRRNEQEIVADFEFSRLHKIVSFIIDFGFIMAIWLPYYALWLLLIESEHLNVFNWVISRNFIRDTDTFLSFFNLAVLFTSSWYYLHKHKKAKRLTIGQYLLSGIK